MLLLIVWIVFIYYFAVIFFCRKAVTFLIIAWPLPFQHFCVNYYHTVNQTWLSIPLRPNIRPQGKNISSRKMENIAGSLFRDRLNYNSS